VRIHHKEDMACVETMDNLRDISRTKPKKESIP
jgi:hypothetical protein